MKCECEAPGFCPRRNCEVGPARWRLCQIPLPEHAPPQRPQNVGGSLPPAIPKAADVSAIGTYLEQIFLTHLGLSSPCGDCKAAIQRLNQMTADQALTAIDTIVADIVTRAGAKAPTWWQRLAVRADQVLGTGQTDRWIRERVLEAIYRASDPV